MDQFQQYLSLVNNCDTNDLLLSDSHLGQHLARIPLQYVSPLDLMQLTQELNLEQLIPTESGLSRDYRGLAELMQFKPVEVDTRFKRSHNPTKSLIEAYLARNSRPSSVSLNDLIKMIEKLERFDILDDLMPILVRVARQSAQTQQTIAQTRSINNQSQSCPTWDLEKLTLAPSDDAATVKPTKYDAFVCFAPEDFETFALRLIGLLEDKGKTVTTADDLMPGHFEHDALMHLIDERCNKVIIVLTSNFSLSKECEFQTKYASELGFKDGSPKIIPVIMEACENEKLPRMIQLLSKIDLTDQGKFAWQFDKLIKSLGGGDGADDARSRASSFNNRSISHSKTAPKTSDDIAAGPIIVSTQSDESGSSINCEPIVDLLRSRASSSNDSHLISDDIRAMKLESTTVNNSSSPLRALQPAFRKFWRAMSNSTSSAGRFSPSTSSRAMLVPSNSSNLSDENLTRDYNGQKSPE